MIRFVSLFAFLFTFNAFAQTPATQWTKFLPFNPVTYGVTDLENDGRSDIHVTSSNAFYVFIGSNGVQKVQVPFQKPAGDWVLRDTDSSETADLNLRARFLDFDKNGSRDVVAVYHSRTARAVLCQMYDLTTKGRRWQSANLPGGIDPTFQVQTANVDTDPAVEVVLSSTVPSATAGMSTTWLRVLDGVTGAGQWTKSVSHATASTPYRFVVDLENNGVSEVGIASSNLVQILNGGTGAVKWQLTAAAPAPGATIQMVAGTRRADLNRSTFADMNNNGAADIIIRWKVSATSYVVQMYQISTKALKWQKTINAYSVIESGALNIDADANREIVLTAWNFYPSMNTTVMAVDGNTGANQWTKSFPGAFAMASIVDMEADGINDVFVGTSTGYFYNGANGTVKWQFTPAAPATGYSGMFEPWANQALRNLDNPIFRDVNGDGVRDIRVQFSKWGSPEIYRLYSLPNKVLKWSLSTPGFLNASQNSDADIALETLNVSTTSSNATLRVHNGQ